MRPNRFSIEHIPKSMSPTGTIDSAPKDFEVYGYQSSENDPEPTKLGRFTYVDSEDQLQYFDVEPSDTTYKYVELRILSNHGNVHYTCLYRFRVHGTRW